ncbi:hypothetical protein C1N61_32670 (plasmid) [Priestia aryabhattai]
MNNMTNMSTQTQAGDVIKQNKTTTKVDAKKFVELVTAIAKSTGMDKWLTEQKIKLVSEKKDYEDYSVYGLVRIKYMKETEKFLGFVGELNNKYRSEFEGMINKTAHVASVLGVASEFKNFRLVYNKFIQELTAKLNLQWNDKSLNKIKWIYDFYEFLIDEYEDVLISFTTQNVYLKKYDEVIKLTEVFHKGGTIIGSENLQLCEYTESYDDVSLTKVKLKVKEYYKSKVLRCSGTNLKLGSAKLDNLVSNVFPEYKYSEKSKNTLLKSIEKGVPSPLVDVVLTSIPVNLKVGSSEIVFEAEYFKCDAGFYVFESEKKRVVFKETDGEMKTYLLERIAKEL